MTDMKRFWTFGAIVLVVLLSSILIFAQDSVPTSPQGKIADNNNDFACNLFRTIYEQKQDGGSFVVSPISVGYLLGMLHEGANGETRRQINDVLGLGGSVQDINEYFKKIMDEAPNVDPTVTVKTANCINLISGYSLIPQYKADMQNYYNALADVVGYDESSIVDKINNWCKKNTDGMIPQILKNGELNPNRVMYLLNAVYFKASWTEKFDPNQTRERNFTQLDGTIVNLPLMHLETRATYGKNDLCKMLCLPYGNKAYSMVVLLPNKGKTTGDIIRNLSAQKLKEWQSQMRTRDVDILMPRFTTESETHLEDILSSMGMPRAFSEDSAEFPNMIQKPKVALFVSMMKQKAKIEVNEEGTKAAAVTVAEMAEKSLPRYEYFYATRPFVYYIMEKSTGAIFFMGTYCFDDTGEQVTIKEPLEEPEIVFERPIESGVKQRDVKRSEDEIFKSVEQMPQFPGGDAALMEYIESNIQYPPMYAEINVQGKVIVQFVVDKTGKVGEVKVVRSVDKELDKEAVRVVQSSPKWKPGKQRDRAVKVTYTFPVIFQLR